MSPFDIALIYLTRALLFNDHVRPVCLATDTRTFLDDAISCYISGWGSISKHDVSLAGSSSTVDARPVSTYSLAYMQ